MDALRAHGTDGVTGANAELESQTSALNRKLRKLADGAIESGEVRTIVFSRGGRYVRMSLRNVAHGEGRWVHWALITNVAQEREEEESERYNALLRGLLPLYNNLYLVNPAHNTFEVISSIREFDHDGDFYDDARERFARFSEKLLHEDDRERFAEFTDYKKLLDRIARLRKGYVSDWFRLRMNDGSYAWREFSVVALSGELSADFLVCVKDAVVEDTEESLEAIARALGFESGGDLAGRCDELQSESELWRTLMRESKNMYFWKDAERRFLGANRAFLDYYGFRSVDEILGKTDEDMGWHADEDVYRSDELDVLGRGATVHDAPGTCIVDGVLRRISATKIPVYRAGKIVGLVGYFVDADDLEIGSRERLDRLTMDPVTGAMSPFGTTLALSDYVAGFRKSNVDFGIMLVEVKECDRLRKDFGEGAFESSLGVVAAAIRGASATSATLGRLGQSRFVVLERGESSDSLRTQATDIARAVHEIREVDGHPCDPIVNYSIAYGSEADGVEELVDLAERRLEENVTEDDGVELFYGERITFGREKFDDLDERIYMADPETYDLVYANRAILEDLGFPEDFDYTGMKCHQLVNASGVPCSFCTNAMLTRESFHTRLHHGVLTGKDYIGRSTLIPWRGRNYRWSMSVCLSDFMEQSKRENELLYLEVNTNDAFKLALREENVDEGIRNLVAHVGKTLEADRAYIFEEDGDGRSASNTYEWCADGVEAEIDTLQNLPMSALDVFYEQFSKGEPLVVEDLEGIREGHWEAYETLARQGIHGLVARQLKYGDRSLGFIAVDNPNEAAFNRSSIMLETLSTFVSILLRNRDASERLDTMSTRDALTGLFNRRKYEQDLVDLQKSRFVSVCMVSVDVNGLKTVNDTYGHTAGDALIKAAASCMSAALDGIGTCYRIGGDEFAAIVLDSELTEAEVSGLLKSSAAGWRGDDGEELTFSVGVSISAGARWKSVERMLSEADDEMYADKRRHYSKKGNDRRKSRGSITKSELANRVSELKTVFDVVRIVDIDKHRALSYDSDGNEVVEPMHCFEIWGRHSVCDNCVSMKAMQDHGRHTRLETKDGESRVVVSQYVEIDGAPSLIEVIHRFTEVPGAAGKRDSNWMPWS